MAAMMTHYESRTRDERFRLSFLFSDLRREIQDARHLQQAASRLCGGVGGGAGRAVGDMSAQMQRQHSNLITLMNEKVSLMGRRPNKVRGQLAFHLLF